MQLDHLQESERRRQVAEGLRGTLAVLNSTRSLEEILDYIVGEARRMMGAQAAAIYRMMPNQVMTIQFSQGLSDDYIAQADIPIGQLATGQAVLIRQPVTLTNLSAMASQDLTAIDPSVAHLLQHLSSLFQSVLSIPLVIKEETIGTLTLYYKEPRSFSTEDIELAVAVCDQSALAIENATLRERVKEEAINAERSRLARELHDSVTQMLFSANLITEVLPTVWNRDPEEGQQALVDLRQLTRGALAEMRVLLLELRPSALQNARLEDLLRQQTEALAGRMRVPVRLDLAGPLNLPIDIKIAFYRIAQEAFNNITRHSGASQVEVSLSVCAGGRGLELSIRDDGGGFDPQQVPSDHLGLSIMRERALSIGAQIDILSQVGGGTEIRVHWRNSPAEVSAVPCETGKGSVQEQR